MSSKYYAHFVTEAEAGSVGPTNTAAWWSCARRCDRQRERRNCARCWRVNFDLTAEEIRILNWATLH